MIKLENTGVFGWDAAIRGMRNPMNSWDKSDSGLTVMNPTDVEFGYEPNYEYIIGANDLKLMQNLSKAGNDHAKFLRMINVTVDITAPLYWWKEFDTYKVGTVANSCSTMHKIHAKEFELDDFSCEYLVPENLKLLEQVIENLNAARNEFINYDSSHFKIVNDSQIVDRKVIWEQMIQILPSSYNQKRTVQLNYQVLKSMYFARKNHKLDEWHTLCDWMLTLPYFKEICVEVGNGEE